MAFKDYDHKFIYVDVGCQSRLNGGVVYRNTDFKVLHHVVNQGYINEILHLRCLITGTTYSHYYLC